MKTKIFTLLMALFAFAWSAKADEITSMKLTISHNGGEFFEVPFPPESWPDLDLTDEFSSSIRIKRIEVETSGTVSNVVFKATMYKTEKGLQPDDDWRTFDLPRQGNTWVLDFGDEAPDLIDSEMGPAPRTFQFFVQAQDGSGKAIYYNNGGQDYKVLFVNGGGSSSSGDIKNLTLTIRLNGGEAFTQDIPAENFPIVDLTDERTTSLIIVKVEVEAEESVSDLQFNGTMYSASEGSPSNDDEWRSYSLQNKGNGKWELDMGEGFELVEPDWLNKPKTKTFEFYVQGTNGSGSQLFYNNGGANYKVTFSTGESTDWKIKFLDGITAGLTFSLDDSYKEYNFNGAGDRVPEDQLGELSSLCIEQFALQFYTADGVKTNDVSLQYRIYEEGQEPEGGWNRIDATYLDNEEGNKMFCYTDMMGINVTNGLEPNKDYVLEVNYQVVVDGEYFFLGKNKEGSKFRFFLTENTSQEEIYSVILTLSHNGGEPFEMYFDHENAVPLNLEGQTTSLKIMKAEVWTSDGIRGVEVFGTMYNTENGGPSGSNEWRAMPLNQSGSGYWMLEFGKEGYEIIEEEWLNNNKSKTFEFYVKGEDGSGNDIFYNNGGANYKVTFSTGEGDDWKVKFLDEVTAELDLRVNDELWVYAFYGDGSRDPSEQPGRLSSLTIEQFDIIFRVKEGLSTKDVSLQYKVYEEGHADEGWWNRIDAQQYFNQGDNIMYCHAENLGQQVADGLEVGKNYVLEVCYQIVINGEYIFFGKDTEDCKFRFCYEDGVVPQEGIRSMTLTINCDGEVFTESFPSEGWEIHAIEGLVSSIKVMRVEVESSESLTYMGFCSTIYDTADGWQHDDTAWDWIPMENQGGGHWVLDWGEGKEFIASEWLNQNVAKTLEFFADGGDANGNKYKYANGISDYGYDNNYKVTFTPGVDPDGISLVSASKEDGATYNLAGQRVRKDYKGIVITNGRKVLIK